MAGYDQSSANDSTDDLGMVMGTNESISVVEGDTNYTVTIPSDAIILRNTSGFWNLTANPDNKPVIITDGTHTYDVNTTPNATGLIAVQDLEKAGFTTRDAQVGIFSAEFESRGWVGSDGLAHFKLGVVGDALSHVETDIASAQPARFMYNGMMSMPENDMTYLAGERVYDPLDGVFRTQDPIHADGDLNDYRFGDNDPVNEEDPTGLMAAGYVNNFSLQTNAGNVGGLVSGSGLIGLAVSASALPDFGFNSSEGLSLDSSLSTLPEGQIPYGESDLGLLHEEFRLGQTISFGRNIATFEFKTPNGLNTITAANIRGTHSEEFIDNAIDALGIDPLDVVRVHSDMQPCQSVVHNCQQLVDTEYPNAAVTYAIPRGQGLPELKQAIQEYREPYLNYGEADDPTALAQAPEFEPTIGLAGGTGVAEWANLSLAVATIGTDLGLQYYDHKQDMKGWLVREQGALSEMRRNSTAAFNMTTEFNASQQVAYQFQAAQPTDAQLIGRINSLAPQLYNIGKTVEPNSSTAATAASHYNRMLQLYDQYYKNYGLSGAEQDINAAEAFVKANGQR